LHCLNTLEISHWNVFPVQGHTKGVNCIRFFPKHGHLLLSAGLDGKAKVWQTVNKRDCMRTYIGHSKGIRDCWFSEGGRKFVTAAYDKAIKLWDTETGSVVQTLGDGQTMAFTVRTHPEQPDVLLAGMQNKKILQYDVRSGDSVQEYNYHLGPVNTLAFIDENRKFISTSGELLLLFSTNRNLGFCTLPFIDLSMNIKMICIHVFKYRR